MVGIDFSGRGKEYKRMSEKIKNTMRSSIDQVIEINEGVDELCMACPLCKSDRCESPQGNEEAVRKYDEKILRGLGLSYGEKLSVRELRQMINQKTPLDFCKIRCPFRSSCRIFNRDNYLHSFNCR
jgi:hypothetical protein